MIALLLLLAVLLVAASVGRRVLALLRTVPGSRLDRLVYSTALGLGVVAYVVLALGLLRLLSLAPTIIALVALLLVCWHGLLETLLDLQPRAAQGRQETGDRRQETGDAAAIPQSAIRNPQSAIGPQARAARALTAVLLLVAAAVVLVDCFVPPGAHEWDALSYHLAAPKVYLAHHRILFLPTDHHSNFPFLVEMLFTVGLLFNGYALANLFHFALAALTAGGIWMLGRRHFSPNAGIVGVWLFATTPIVLWEAGAAYIELGMCLYVLLAVGAALEFRRAGNPRWLALSGVLMGFGLSVKALALLPFVLLAGALLLGGARFRNLRWYLAAAIVVGCPFYVKSWVMTGNPVYPFAYRVFGGRYWNQTLADAYAANQGPAFGLHNALYAPVDELKGAREDTGPDTVATRVRNLFLAPFALVSVPRIFYDFADPGILTQLGFLFLALPVLALLASIAGRVSPAAAWVGLLAAAWYVVWSQTMQYVRYLVPLLPLLALVGGEGADRLGRSKVVRWAAGAALLFQAALALGWFGARLFSNPGDKPGQLAVATRADAREEYLTRQLNSYASMQWLNHNTPAGAGVALFEEPRGFYLDRPYLWGNSLHSTYIPYPTFATGPEMVDWFLAHGVQYALVNLRFAPPIDQAGGADAYRDAVTSGTTPALFLQWYDPHTAPETFRRLLGDSVAAGRAAILPEASKRGVVVLRFLPPNRGGAR